MRLSKKVAAISNECVACGACEKVCPLGAISIFRGLYALVDRNKCIGCGKCQKVCPASVISIIDREEQNEKKEILV
ncbi:MAG: 4Fe-4S binding protein [Clostridiales bacterium]|jgi:ferredoxin|nr:4Fe-4S binding protein [Clostridiales bacterium]